MNLLLSDPAFLATSGGVSSPGDPYFSNVALLLHGDGANGSTTIIDSSPSPKTVTASGNAKISTAQSNPFGGSNSILISTSLTNGLLTIPTISFALNESFTVEAWLFKTGVHSSGYSTLFAGGGSNQFGYDTPATSSVFMYLDASMVATSSGPVIPTNDWCHVAYTRDVATCRVFVDGILQGSGTRGNAFLLSTLAGLSLGAQNIVGYIDEVRITKGVARYTSNFTPPTAPFPDI